MALNCQLSSSRKKSIFSIPFFFRICTLTHAAMHRLLFSTLLPPLLPLSLPSALRLIKIHPQFTLPAPSIAGFTPLIGDGLKWFEVFIERILSPSYKYQTEWRMIFFLSVPEQSFPKPSPIYMWSIACTYWQW